MKSDYELLAHDAPAPFVQPQEELSPDVEAEVQLRVAEECRSVITAFVNRLATLLLESRDPQADLIAMLFLNKFDLTLIIGCEDNSGASVAKHMGITRQSFHERCQSVGKQLSQEPQPRKCPARRKAPLQSPVARLAARCKQDLSCGRLKKEQVKVLFDGLVGKKSAGLN